MAKDDAIELTGIVTKVLKGTNFEVTLENGLVVQAYLSGKLRTNHIKIIQGDEVTVALSPYDLKKGRITWRGSKKS